MAGIVAAQIAAALAVVQSAVPADDLVAVHLTGSAVAGGLRPDSDLDLLVVVGRRLAATEKRAIVDGLIPFSDRLKRPAGWRPLEVTVVALPDITPWRYPPTMDLQYGEWKRETLGDDSGLAAVASPDLAVVLTSARQAGQAVLGPSPQEVIPLVPESDLRRAMTDEVPSLLGDLATDTRNVLLTLARIWATVDTGQVVAKDEAATWAAERLPADLAEVLDRAGRLYRDGGFGPWDDDRAVQRAAEAMVGAIAAIGGGRPSLPPVDQDRARRDLDRVIDPTL